MLRGSVRGVAMLWGSVRGVAMLWGSVRGGGNVVGVSEGGGNVVGVGEGGGNVVGVGSKGWDDLEGPHMASRSSSQPLLPTQTQTGEQKLNHGATLAMTVPMQSC